MTYEEKRKAIIRAKKWIQDVIDYHQDILNGEEPDDIEKAIFEECEVILDALGKQVHSCEDCKHADYIPSANMIYCLEHSCVMRCDNYCRDWSDEE